MIDSKRLLFSMTVLALSCVAGCSKPAKIKIDPSEVRLGKLGETAELKAVVLDTEDKPIDGVKLTWISSTTDVGRVDEKGKVTAVSTGTTLVSASYKEIKASATVKVKMIGTIEVAPDAIELKGVGVTGELKAVVKDEKGKPLGNEKVTWASDNQQVATVDENGIVKSISAGEAKVTATAATASVIAVVKVVIPEVASFTVAPSPAEVVKGQTIKLIATALDATGFPIPGTIVTWSSSDPSKATVDEQGVVSGINYGKVTISAQSKEKVSTAIVRVR